MRNWKIKIRELGRRWERELSILGAAAVLTAILLSLEFNLLEANLYDFRMAFGPQRKADTRIALVTLDDATAKALDEIPPFTLDIHARFLEALEKLSPKAVGYLINMNQVSQANPEMFRQKWGTRFVDSARKIQEDGGRFVLGTPFDVQGEVLPPYPLSSLPHSLALIHRDGNVFANDKVTRRAYIYQADKPAFHMDLAQKLGILRPGSSLTGSFAVQEMDGDLFFFRYHGSTVMNWKHPDRLPYERVSFLDVIQGRLPEGYFKGKIVLVGSLIQGDSSDFTATPYSKTPFMNPKLLVHANILDSVLHDEGIRRTPMWVNWVTTFLFTSVVLWSVLTSTPLIGLFSTLGLGFAFLLTGWLLFHLKNGIWLRESQTLVGIFAGYYVAVPYRLIREYKKRWAYQRQNELLKQVEEMKTNFLSLVTHDLKTPVARINGLAELLLRKASDRLVPRDKETIQHIIDSTDELNRFISSILELSKVESNRVQLRLESKDINQLIERSVDGFKAQSKAMNVRIETALEPLFPVKMDASLIEKVLNNLIDNAMKYSPPGTKIRVASREVDRWIEIAVSDRGIGMSPEEIQQLFTRFYRAKNDTTTRIAGTGLGLYLTKYFIEAHRGRVIVESEKNLGSTFKILLPLNAGDSAEASAPAAGQEKHFLTGLTRRLASAWRDQDAAEEQ